MNAFLGTVRRGVGCARLAAVAACAAGVLWLPPARAADAGPAELAVPATGSAPLKFEIKRFTVTGNTLLPQRRIDAVLAPFVGRGKDFGDVQRALEALQDAYVAAHYGVVLVTLPEQELEQGEVKFAVVEPKLGNVEIEGNQFYDNANIRRSLPSLQEGKTPNSNELARNLWVVNQNPAKGQQVLLRAGANEGEVDATVRVVDSKPQRFSLSLDSTGTKQTGYLRAGVSFQETNAFNSDVVVTGTYITSPDHYDTVNIFALGATIPLYALGDSVSLLGAYSNVDSGVVQNLYNVSGAGWVFSARYNRNLPRYFEGYTHQLIAGYDYMAFNNRVTTVGAGIGLVPDITVQPLSLTYSGTLLRPNQQLGFYAGYYVNAFNGGTDQNNEAFQASRLNATPYFHLSRFGATWVYAFPQDWQFRFNSQAQYTRDALIPAMQIGFGGLYNIRGFTERAYSADMGWWANFELYTPDLGPKLQIDGGQLRFLVFRDTGWGKYNYNQAPQNPSFGLDSFGFGLRYLYKDSVTIRLDAAKVTHDGAGITAQDGRRYSGRIGGAVVWQF
jgi:hemolysin activation/secretion protein